ncbi:MAG: threonine synthase [Gammaproteobacteria bacterium]|nr:threonine synthase [Pseudomonadota bacterium]TDJ11730.1 MAG: threonine synthase [Gammaproteobacteria bacterium]
MPSYVSHLEAAIDGTRLPAREQHTLHEGRPIWVRYDLGAVSRAMDKEVLQKRPPTIWRYRELLPAEDESVIVSLGEGMSPLLRCDRLGGSLGLSNLFIKDESQMPTGSFKDRGQTVAITMAKWFGVKRVAIPTAGNAGGSMAAYAARAGMEAFVFMPEDTPEINQYEAVQAGAHAYLVNGLINDCAKIVLDGRETMGWFDFSTLKEPYRIEGKKTMGLELAEQLDWSLPDVILYPTGGGTGLIGMWKAFQELDELGWLDGERMPRMVAVQSDGCCPIVRAFDRGEKFAEPFENATTIALGLRVPAAVGDFMILDAIRASDGCAVAVSEQRITEWMRLGTEAEGISIGPESAACIGAAESLLSSGWLTPDERVVLFNCGGARKYPKLIQAELPRLDKDHVPDWALFEADLA